MLTVSPAGIQIPRLAKVSLQRDPEKIRLWLIAVKTDINALFAKRHVWEASHRMRFTVEIKCEHQELTADEGVGVFL